MREDNKSSGSDVKLICWVGDTDLLLDECLDEDLVIMVPSQSVDKSSFQSI